MMATDYYVVGNLRKDYEETYSKLASQWEKYAQRGYDIIDKVQKEGKHPTPILPFWALVNTFASSLI